MQWTLVYQQPSSQVTIPYNTIQCNIINTIHNNPYYVHSFVAISYFFLEQRGISFTILTTLCNFASSVGYNLISCHIETGFLSLVNLSSAWTRNSKVSTSPWCKISSGLLAYIILQISVRVSIDTVITMFAFTITYLYNSIYFGSWFWISHFF